MSRTIGVDSKKIMLLSFVAAGTTIIAGILHLTMVPRSISHNPLEGILFLVGGILQIFWAVPVIKRWDRIWQIIGIVGTVIFVALWFSDRLHLMPEGAIQVGTHSNPPPGEFPRGNMQEGGISRGITIGGIALPTEICQIAFVGLYAVLIKLYSRK